MRYAMAMAGEREVDAYIAAAPGAVRPMLVQVRALIKSAAPQAEEKISYGMPFYEYRGRLLYFAAHKTHVGLYPLGKARDLYATELKGYLTGRSTARFPIGGSLPVELITKVIEARVEEADARAGGEASR
jgi:uncharacterized protein YdhG (YjbR/CyaY superfamily)